MNLGAWSSSETWKKWSAGHISFNASSSFRKKLLIGLLGTPISPLWWTTHSGYMLLYAQQQAGWCDLFLKLYFSLWSTSTCNSTTLFIISFEFFYCAISPSPYSIISSDLFHIFYHFLFSICAGLISCCIQQTPVAALVSCFDFCEPFEVRAQSLLHFATSYYGCSGLLVEQNPTSWGISLSFGPYQPCWFHFFFLCAKTADFTELCTLFADFR